MKCAFVDTHYLLALVNSRDKHHTAAIQLSAGTFAHLVTTTWVLVEFADALSSVSSRVHAAHFLRQFRAEKFVEVVSPSADQFDRALDLYEQRPDKEWSLTDCISFLLMEDRRIGEALTADHHFEQAGYRALLFKT